MKLQKDLHDLDRICEELGIINKTQNEFLANLNWEEGETSDLTQFGNKLSNLYTLGMHQLQNNMFLTKVDNVWSNISIESLIESEQNLLEQRGQMLLNQLAEFSPVYCKIEERIDQLRDEIFSIVKTMGHWDPAVIHYLEKGDADQQHTLKVILELLYPDGYDSISTPLRKATDSQDTEIVSSSTTCDSVTVTDEPKNDSSITDSHVQRKHFDTGSKYKSKANRKYGTSQKLKLPRVDKKKFKFIKRAKGTKKNNSNSKVKSKIGYINKTNLNDLSNAMAFHSRLLLKWPRVKFKNKLY